MAAIYMYDQHLFRYATKQYYYCHHLAPNFYAAVLPTRFFRLLLNNQRKSRDWL